MVVCNSRLSSTLSLRIETEFLTRDAEIGCGIVCGCLPILPAFFRQFKMGSTKAASHMNTHLRNRIHGTPSKDSTNSTYDGSVTVVGDAFGSRMLKGRYLELEELPAEPRGLQHC